MDRDLDTEIYCFSRFFPPHIQKDEYVAEHFKYLRSCIKHKLYASAYFHLHILFMVFIHNQIFRISKDNPKIHKKFSKMIRKNKEASIYALARIKESSLLKFLKDTNLRWFDFEGSEDFKLSEDFLLVLKERNEHLHATGKMPVRDSRQLRIKIDEYIYHMQDIVFKQIDLLEDIYSDLLRFDWDISDDVVDIDLSDEENNLSDYELRFVAEGKDDVLSRFIQREYGPT